MITRPLDLQSKLSAPPRDADFLFWLNVCAVTLFFALFVWEGAIAQPTL